MEWRTMVVPRPHPRPQRIRRATRPCARLAAKMFRLNDSNSDTSCHFGLERDDVRKIAVEIVKIQSIADDKLIRDFKANVIRVHALGAGPVLSKQHAYFHIRCAEL